LIIVDHVVSSWSFIMSFESEYHTSVQHVRGRPFAKGNSGRRPGSKNKHTGIAQAMLKEAAPELMRKALEMAKGGNERLLKLFLDRLLPKRLVEVELPEINFASDVVDGLSAVLAAMRAGKISPSEGAAVASILGACGRTINVADLELRLATIEAKLKESAGEISPSEGAVASILGACRPTINVAKQATIEAKLKESHS
jgi:hypothetical protein